MLVHNEPTCMNCGETDDHCECELAYLGGEQFEDDFDLEPSSQENLTMELETLPIPTLNFENDDGDSSPSYESIVDNGLESLPIPAMNFNKPEKDHGASDHSGESSQLESLPIPKMW